MREIVVPRLNSNDDTCVLVEWTLADGAKVSVEDTIAVVETAKAAADVHSEATGVLHPTVAAGAQCQVGEVIGYVFPDEEGRRRYVESTAGMTRPADEGGPTPVLTDAARTLSERAGLSQSRLRALGKRIIRESDVAALVAAEHTAPPTPALSPRQRAIAEVVGRAHRTVPDAFVLMKVYCDDLAARLREAGADGPAIGLVEASIAVLAGLRERFPTCFATVDGDGRPVAPAAETNIGVTVDVGTGLFVPVLKDLGSRTAREIAEQLMGLRVTALRDAFHPGDLSGGQLSVSLNMDTGVLFALPIVLAPQVCMVSLGSVQSELVLDDDGEVAQRAYLTVGLTYDHRVINGRDATEFLTAFKTAVESAREIPL